MSDTNPLHEMTHSVKTADVEDSVAVIRAELEQSLAKLADYPEGGDPVGRALIQLEIASALINLNRGREAWTLAREIFDTFLAHDRWEEAVQCCDILFEADQPESLPALGMGVWLGVTFPINPELSIKMLHHIVDQTPKDSDGAPVAAMLAHYLAGLRAVDEDQRKNLEFVTSQVVGQVAKRHRNIEDQETLNTWVEMYELNDPQLLLQRMRVIIDALVGGKWWFDQDAVRSRIPG